MQLIIKNGIVIATHEDGQVVANSYPDSECVTWDKELPVQGPFYPPLRDPRSDEEKKLVYLDKRRVAYPSVQEQLDMLYHDMVNGTETWVQEIEKVKQQYPQPDTKAL